MIRGIWSVHRDAAAVESRHLPQDVQPQPAAEDMAGLLVPDAHELPEEASLLVGRHADARVDQVETQFRTSGPVTLHLAYFHDDLPFFGKLDRIVGQIEQYLPQAKGIPG